VLTADTLNSILSHWRSEAANGRVRMAALTTTLGKVCSPLNGRRSCRAHSICCHCPHCDPYLCPAASVHVHRALRSK